MRFGALDIDPSRSPAVLDTETWDREAACRQVRQRQAELAAACDRARGAAPGAVIPAGPIRLHVCAQPGTEANAARQAIGRSAADVRRDGALGLLAALADGQKLIITVSAAESPLGEPLLRFPVGQGRQAEVHPTDAAVVDRFCRVMRPMNAPRALSRTPRLGIGCRMTTRAWPGIFDAMEAGGFAANSIQNSVRELNLLSDLEEGRPPERNYASGFGMIEPGYTGSTFEGLWVAGVLAALAREKPLAYGADADHIQIKRADVKLERPLRVIDAARYYTFFTLDMADVLAYDALAQDGGRGPGGGPADGAAAGSDFLDLLPGGSAGRREILAYHGEPFRAGARTWRLDPEIIQRFVGKYWRALDAVGPLAERIRGHKGGEPFDLEFAFDEHPPEIRGPDCISSGEEVVFVVRELARRGLPVTHIAPNFGVEKGQDYRLPDGYDGLQARISSLFGIAEEAGLMLDFHSADDLAAGARRAIRAATGGRMHFKISPVLHALFAETVCDHSPDLFRRWWDDALAYARTEAASGSPVAAHCLEAYRASADASPSPRHDVFREFFFAFPGRRDADGRFINREAFYTLPESAYDDYRRRVAAHLRTLAGDLFTA